MKNTYKLLALLIPVLVSLSSCQKGGNDDDNTNPSCNNTAMKLKKWQATFDADNYIETTWNTDGTIRAIKMNTPLSEYRTATYIYANGKIKEAVLSSNSGNVIEDTAVFHYNAEGKVDSMYLKHDDYFDIKLTYTNGKLSKYTRYAAGMVMFYYNVTTDANDNIIKSEEYWNGGSVFNKESTFTLTRDDRKNPLAGLAPFMFYLDDGYNIFWYWGPNNYTDQRYQDHTGGGLDITSGFKYKYNSNCYPGSSQTTLAGQVVFVDDDFTFTYY